MNQDIIEPDAEPTNNGGISNYVLLIIYGLSLALALSVGGSIQLYRSLHPATPAQEIARAVDALHSGEDAIARRVLEKLAADGNAEAEYWLADVYEQGLGTPKDIGKAVALFESAAANGFMPAQERLGEVYLAGVEVDPDYGRAMAVLSKAAATGSAMAQRLLGQMYAAGLGEPRDAFKAAVYYSAAAINGDDLAVPERNSAIADLSPDQIARIPSEIARLGLVKQS